MSPDEHFDPKIDDPFQKFNPFRVLNSTVKTFFSFTKTNKKARNNIFMHFEHFSTAGQALGNFLLFTI